MDHQEQNTEGEADRKIENLLADPAILQQLARLDAPH